ncbi:MAG: hypothetical protein IKC55_02705, partial [Clostridia bacterium]|nr:hypothetical protein [Clostridia bacterium]
IPKTKATPPSLPIPNKRLIGLENGIAISLAPPELTRISENTIKGKSEGTTTLTQSFIPSDIAPIAVSAKQKDKRSARILIMQKASSPRVIPILSVPPLFRPFPALAVIPSSPPA